MAAPIARGGCDMAIRLLPYGTSNPPALQGIPPPAFSAPADAAQALLPVASRRLRVAVKRTVHGTPITPITPISTFLSAFISGGRLFFPTFCCPGSLVLHQPPAGGNKGREGRIQSARLDAHRRIERNFRHHRVTGGQVVVIQGRRQIAECDRRNAEMAVARRRHAQADRKSTR